MADVGAATAVADTPVTPVMAAPPTCACAVQQPHIMRGRPHLEPTSIHGEISTTYLPALPQRTISQVHDAASLVPTKLTPAIDDSSGLGSACRARPTPVSARSTVCSVQKSGIKAVRSGGARVRGIHVYWRGWNKHAGRASQLYNDLCQCALCSHTVRLQPASLPWLDHLLAHRCNGKSVGSEREASGQGGLT